jgi:hypothetical protein
MMHRYAYTNAKLNSLLQQKGNETMPTIKRTPLETNTLIVIANKVDDTSTKPISAEKEPTMQTMKPSSTQAMLLNML